MADKKKQVEGVIARMRKTAEDLLTQASDLEAVLNGDDTTGQQVGRLFDRWALHWRARYRNKYVFVARAKAGAGFKRLLKDMTLDDIDARMQQYVASNDPFYTMTLHSIDAFFTAVNKFPGTGTTTDEAQFLQAPVGDCTHSPRCKSDQEHTRRRGQDMRA